MAIEKCGLGHRLHWRQDRQFNIGDRLTCWLYEKFTGVAPKFADVTSSDPYLCLIGSFLQIVNEHAVVWGTGVLDAREIPCPSARYYAVRGPRTRKMILDHGGICPEIYADPALLTPYFLPTTQSPKYVGIIPHWTERDLLLYQKLDDPAFKVLDITGELNVFVRELATCEVVLSSSLHGLILAHAYGIPAGWIEPTSKPLGDGMKFHDYLEGVGTSAPDAPRVPSSQADLLAMTKTLVRSPAIALDDFLAVCPLPEFTISKKSNA